MFDVQKWHELLGEIAGKTAADSKNAKNQCEPDATDTPFFLRPSNMAQTYLKLGNVQVAHSAAAERRAK